MSGPSVKAPGSPAPDPPSGAGTAGAGRGTLAEPQADSLELFQKLTGGRPEGGGPDPGGGWTLSGAGRDAPGSPAAGPPRGALMTGAGKGTLAEPQAGSLELFQKLTGGRPEGGGPAPGVGGPLSGDGRDAPGGAARQAPGQLPGEAPEAPETPETPESLSSLLSSVMGGLGDLGRPPAAGGGVPVDRPAEARPAAGPELVEGLVSRILVSEPTAAGHEARLLVDPSLLPGTEIHLARGLDGFLTVSLLSSDPGSLQALVQARGDLERALDRVEGTGFKVTVGDGRGGGAEDGDRRSRGLDFTGEPE